jgi:hypothetical protein
MHFETKAKLLEYIKIKYSNYYIQDMTTEDDFPPNSNYHIAASYTYNPLNTVLVWIKK